MNLTISSYTLLAALSLSACSNAQGDNANLVEKAETEANWKSSMPGFLFLEEIKKEDPLVYKNLNEAYEKINADQEACITEFAARSKERDPNFRKNIKRHEWPIYASVSSENGVGRFTDALVNDSSPWPSYFDDEVKSCYLDSLEKVTFQPEKDFAFKIILKACVFPRPEN